ncbi:MAG: SET domain-containing protein [Flavobacteriales bacterium]|nr:SET domain-containing protein [Flavobacteriales bacterium]
MMHPDTALRYVSPERGFGVVATAPIPKGTILYVQDPLDIVIRPGDPINEDPLYRRTFATYAYIEPDGTRIVCWDHGKYMNHCCHPNSLSTGYGFEVAIQNIAKDDEITDHYGVLNLEHDMELSCSRTDCCKRIGPGTLKREHEWMDVAIRTALSDVHHVAQPLMGLLKPSIDRALTDYLRNGYGYRSVLSLQHVGPNGV